MLIKTALALEAALPFATLVLSFLVASLSQSKTLAASQECQW
jgi:hypothetical protein